MYVRYMREGLFRRVALDLEPKIGGNEAGSLPYTPYCLLYQGLRSRMVPSRA